MSYKDYVMGTSESMNNQKQPIRQASDYDKPARVIQDGEPVPARPGDSWYRDGQLVGQVSFSADVWQRGNIAFIKRADKLILHEQWRNMRTGEVAWYPVPTVTPGPDEAVIDPVAT